MVADSVDDPQGANWGGYTWSAWCSFDHAIAPLQANCPDQPGLYRLRCGGQNGLIYIGETGDELIGRLRQLSKATPYVAAGKKPGLPHPAGACVLAYEQKELVVEVSWVAAPHIDERERKGVECDPIAAYRQVMGASPSCQFGGGR
jgi:hypothetical protein